MELCKRNTPLQEPSITCVGYCRIAYSDNHSIKHNNVYYGLKVISLVS